MPFTLCVPARRLASCQWITRAMMSTRGSAAKISSGSSALPTAFASKSTTSNFIDLALQRRGIGGIRRPRLLDRIAHQHVAALGTGDRAAHEDKVTFRVHTRDLQVKGGHALLAEMASHLLVLEGLAGILTVTGRTKRTMA